MLPEDASTNATEPGPLTAMIEANVKSEVYAVVREAAEKAIEGLDIEALVGKEIDSQVERVITRKLEQIVEQKVKWKLDELTRRQISY